MPVRGIRGAITVERNDAPSILSATQELLQSIILKNQISPEEVGSVIFTATPDLDAAAPARAARDLGWTAVPLLCMPEMPVSGSLPMCIRVLIHWNTDRLQNQIHHIYLGRARVLRPDLMEEDSL